MKNFYTEEQWNEILKQQESVLRYDTFTRKQALELGLLIAEITGEKSHGDELAAGTDGIESRRTGSILESARGELLRVRRLHPGFHERWKPSVCLCDGIRHGTLGRSSGDRGCDGETAGS